MNKDGEEDEDLGEERRMCTRIMRRRMKMGARNPPRWNLHQE